MNSMISGDENKKAGLRPAFNHACFPRHLNLITGYDHVQRYVFYLALGVWLTCF